jgi:hypothetical protein
MGCWGVIVGIVTRLRAAGNGVQFLTGAVYFSLLQNMQIFTVVYSDSYAIDIGDSFPRFKQAG